MDISLKRRVPGSVLGALGFSLLLTACGNDSGSDGGGSVTMAMVPKTSNNLVFEMGDQGAQVGAQDLTASSGVEVRVEYLASKELDPEVQAEHIRDAIDMGVDGLLVSCLDSSTSGPVDDAVEAGIPVITFDSDCPDSDRLGFYSMESEETGAKGADLLASAMGSGEKKVAILNGRAGADNLERRIDGFMERLEAEYPDIEVVMTGNCAETAESCGEVLEDEIIANNPDLDGLFVVGLWGLEAGCTCDKSAMNCTCEDDQLPAWKSAAKDGLKTVTYDSLPFQLELVKQGYVSALIGQKYFGWGYDTVSIMFDHLTAGRKVDDFIDSRFDVVCENNVEDMSSKWHASDFRRPLEPECDL